MLCEPRTRIIFRGSCVHSGSFVLNARDAWTCNQTCGTGPGAVFANGTSFSQGQLNRNTLAPHDLYRDLQAERDGLETYDESFQTDFFHQHLRFSVQKVKISADAAGEYQDKYDSARSEEWYRSLMNARFWSTLTAKIVEKSTLIAKETELMYSTIFGTWWLEDQVGYKSGGRLQRSDPIQTPIDTSFKKPHIQATSNTNASGATAPHPKEVVATDKTKTEAIGWAGQLFIKRAGWPLAWKPHPRHERCYGVVGCRGHGGRELCENDRTLGSYDVPKEVRPLAPVPPFPSPPLFLRNRVTLNSVSGARRR